MTQPKQPATLETMTTARDYWYGRAIHLEAEHAAALERIKELEGELELAEGMCEQVGHESDMIFDRGAKRLARIKELESQLAERSEYEPVLFHSEQLRTIVEDYMTAIAIAYQVTGLDDKLELCRRVQREDEK